MLSANVKPKRTATASRGFLAVARLSCLVWVKCLRCIAYRRKIPFTLVQCRTPVTRVLDYAARPYKSERIDSRQRQMIARCSALRRPAMRCKCYYGNCRELSRGRIASSRSAGRATFAPLWKFTAPDSRRSHLLTAQICLREVISCVINSIRKKIME